MVVEMACETVPTRWRPMTSQCAIRGVGGLADARTRDPAQMAVV
jgi:hypothetical protein